MAVIFPKHFGSEPMSADKFQKRAVCNFQNQCSIFFCVDPLFGPFEANNLAPDGGQRKHEHFRKLAKKRKNLHDLVLLLRCCSCGVVNCLALLTLFAPHLRHGFMPCV